MRTLLALLLLSSSTSAAEFTVVNRTTPQLIVVNKTTPKAAPVVAAKKSFQYNANHRCPSCGYDRYPDTYIVRGAGPVAGTHVHSCPRCNTSWYH